MRRPHRSIETFDISLMAVVTKAMGAFLVLMLLLIPYYSSGPIGQQSAEDLAKTIDALTKTVQQLEAQLKQPNGDVLRSQLDEVLKRLDEVLAQLQAAQKLVAQLKQANDALNAQVRRLEAENAALKQQLVAALAQIQQLNARVADLASQVQQLGAQIGALQQQNAELRAQVAALLGQVQQLNAQIAALQEQNAQLRRTQGNKGYFISASLLAPTCTDVAVHLGIYTATATIDYPTEKGSADVLNARSMGQNVFLPSAKDRLGNSSAFLDDLYLINYYIVVTTTSLDQQVDYKGLKVAPLKRPSGDCAGTLFIAANMPKGYSTFEPYQMKLPKDRYATLIAIIAVGREEIDLVDPGAPDFAWLQARVDHAAKVP